MPRTAQNQTTMKTLRTIQTEWARTALWEMAEYLPGMLLRMYREEPRELVTWIEETVDKALDWKKAALANGSDPQLVEELFRERLKPDYCPGGTRANHDQRGTDGRDRSPIWKK